MKRILVIGDVLLDKYDFCVHRENPESNAPCFTVIETNLKIGGAGNVAANLESLGSKVKLISVVGKDESADKIKTILKKSNIDFDLIEDEERSTIIKERILSKTSGEYFFRKDTEKKEYIREKHVLEILNSVKADDLIIISDYNKGVISKELVSKLKDKGNTILVDPKPAHTTFYNDLFLITPNLIEAIEMTREKDWLKAGKILVNQLKTNVLLKKGANGVSFFGTCGERFDIDANAKKVFDVTGAGDTVIAVLTHFYNKGFSLKESIKLANDAAGIAIGFPGCYQISEKEILKNQRND
jgi:D-glycero-beta-D-manno-heptose-7-phosphate kinase